MGTRGSFLEDKAAGA